MICDPEPTRLAAPIATGTVSEAHGLFQQPWWLDAVAPGTWQAVAVGAGGVVEARLPFTTRRRYGMRIVGQPPLTPFLGPWLRPFDGKPANRIAHEHELMGQLVDALPAHDLFRQHFHHSVANWLPFYWRGYAQTTLYTYRLDDLWDRNAVWTAFRENVRREIRKAARQLEVVTDEAVAGAVDKFLSLNRATFERQGRGMPYSHDLVQRIDAACGARGVRRMFFAQDAAGRLHAALYMVWDSGSAYYLMGGADPEHRTSGAMSLLMWEAIQHARQVTKAFDFEGSMRSSIERYVRAFGGRQTPYFRVCGARSVRGRVADLLSGLRHSRAG